MFGVLIVFIVIKLSMVWKVLLLQICVVNVKICDWVVMQKGVIYFDVFILMFGEDGQLQLKWFCDDGLYMNCSGYELWIGIVKLWVDVYGW